MLLLALGEYKRIVDCLREAEHLAEALGDEKLGRVYGLMTVALVGNGDLNDPSELAARSSVAARCDDVGLEFATTSYLDQVHYYRWGPTGAGRPRSAENIGYLTGQLASTSISWLARTPIGQSRAFADVIASLSSAVS